MKVSIDEGTVHLMLAAYRMGKQDAQASAPKDFLRRCIRIIEADSADQANAAIREPSND